MERPAQDPHWGWTGASCGRRWRRRIALHSAPRPGQRCCWRRRRWRRRLGAHLRCQEAARFRPTRPKRRPPLRRLRAAEWSQLALRCKTPRTGARAHRQWQPALAVEPRRLMMTPGSQASSNRQALTNDGVNGCHGLCYGLSTAQAEEKQKKDSRSQLQLKAWKAHPQRAEVALDFRRCLIVAAVVCGPTSLCATTGHPVGDPLPEPVDPAEAQMTRRPIARCRTPARRCRARAWSAATARSQGLRGRTSAPTQRPRIDPAARPRRQRGFH